MQIWTIYHLCIHINIMFNMDTKPVRYSWKVVVLIHSLKQKKPGEKTHILGRVLHLFSVKRGCQGGSIRI